MKRARALACGAATVAVTWLAEAAAAPSIAVVETRAAPALPATAAAAVTRQIYASIARLGYRAAPEARVAALATQISPGQPTPGALLRLAGEAHTDHALGSSLGAAGGHYVVTLVLANADRTGPFVVSASADPATLEPSTDRLVRSLFPPAAEEGGARADAPSGATPAAGTEKSPSPRVAVQTEAAFGLTSPGFYNHLIGARYDHRFTDRFALGGYVGYVNLKGKEGRASNVLPYLQLEYRVRPSSSSGIDLPIRFGTGYLPKNGPFLRLAGGFSFPLGDATRLGFDVLAPTFWNSKDLTVVSLDLAAEVTFDL